MAKYNFGGGISGEASKVARRKKMGFENGKKFTFKNLDKFYVDFLSCLKTIKTKNVSNKADATWKLEKVIYTMYDKKAKTWKGLDVLPKK